MAEYQPDFLTELEIAEADRRDSHDTARDLERRAQTLRETTTAGYDAAFARAMGQLYDDSVNQEIDPAELLNASISVFGHHPERNHPLFSLNREAILDKYSRLNRHGMPFLRLGGNGALAGVSEGDARVYVVWDEEKPSTANAKIRLNFREAEGRRFGTPVLGLIMGISVNVVSTDLHSGLRNYRVGADEINRSIAEDLALREDSRLRGRVLAKAQLLAELCDFDVTAG